MSLLLAVDATNLAHRAYFAAPGGHATLFSSWLGKLTALHRPDETYLAVDAPTCFRRALDPAYKAGRAEKANDLVCYLDALRSLHPCPDGFEADDLIATRVARHDGLAVVVSGDLDLCAVVSGRVRLVRPPAWETTLGPEEVYGILGVWPDQVCAYKAIRGDASDNVPGVRGIGPVKARRLLETHGTFEGVLLALTPAQQEEAQAAWRLVALRDDAPIEEGR